MSVFTALTRTSPEIDGVSFDAVLESTLTGNVTTTGYTLESGVEVKDHALFLPLEYTMTILASNNPLQPGITDFIGGAVSNFIPGLAGAAGALTGLLSASAETHAQVVLQSLIESMARRIPVDITGDDINLTSMLITSVSRTRTAENENGLECDIVLQELPLIERIQSDDFGAGQVSAEDPASTKSGGIIQRGSASVRKAGDKIRARSAQVFGKVVLGGSA